MIRTFVVASWLGCVSTAWAAEPVPRFAWSFGAKAEATVAPEHGALAAHVVGPVRVAQEPPAIVLDGKANRIAITEDLAAAKLPERAISVEAWVAVDKTQEWGGIVGALEDNGDYERGWLLGMRQARFAMAVASTGKKRLTYLTAGEDLKLGEWYYVVGTYDGEWLRLFVDGELAAVSREQSGDIFYPPKAFFEVGAYHDKDETYPIAGRIAAASVFDVALTAAEVRARFDARKAAFPDVEPVLEDVAHWPTYHRDNRRSGLTTQKLPERLVEKWTYQAALPPQPAWPPPARQDFWNNKPQLPARVVFDRAFHVVSDGQLVCFGSSANDQVVCLDLATGQTRWSFFAEGPVRLAPTLHDGRAYFGADDGCVYCLNAADGKLVWKYRCLPDGTARSLAQNSPGVAASQGRLLPGNGRMISLWPVRSGVLVEDGRARFAAGLFQEQGTFQFALDAKTGEELARATIAFSPQGYMERDGRELRIAQGRAPKTTVARIARSGKTRRAAFGSPEADKAFVIVGTPDLRILGGDGVVTAYALATGEPVWSLPTRGRAYSLALAGGCLLASSDQGTIHCFGPETGRLTPHRSPTGNANEEIGEERRDVLRRYEPVARRVLQGTAPRGWCLVLGADHAGALAAEIATRSEWQVVVAEPRAEVVAAARRALDAAGLYGRVVVHHVPFDKLPYGTCLFQRIVCESDAVTADALFDWLVPGRGVAFVGFRGTDGPLGEPTGTLRRPPLPRVGEWTHLYAEPGNSACSGDERIGTEFALQWFGPPGPRDLIDRHHRTVSPLYKAGRLFVPGDNRVYCVDAYNGTPYWEVGVPGSRRVGVMRDCGSMAVTDDRLYLAAADQCWVIDVATGGKLREFATPVAADGLGRQSQWGYLAVVGERLFGSSTAAGASRGGLSRAQISETFYDHVPLVVSDELFCLDRVSGTLRWRYRPRGAIVNSTLTIGGGRQYFVESRRESTVARASSPSELPPTTRAGSPSHEPTGRVRLSTLFDPGADLVALDAATGRELWRRDFPGRDLQHVLYLAYSEERLVASGTKNRQTGPKPTVWFDLYGFDATTGNELWHKSQNQEQGINGDHGEQDRHPVIVNGVVYQEPHAYDLATGQPRERWRMIRGGHGCGSASASANSLFFRAGNPAVCDLSSGRITRVNQVSRPGCWINMIPAGGLLLIPEASSGCSCNFPIQSSMVFAPK